MDFNLQEAGDLTKLELYQNNNAFRVMLDAIGVDLDQRNRLTNDGFDSMKAIIDLHSNDVEGFKITNEPQQDLRVINQRTIKGIFFPCQHLTLSRSGLLLQSFNQYLP